MAIKLPPLPYDLNALEPYMSQETLEYHYGKHHKTYVEKANELIKGTSYERLSLEDIVRKSYEKDRKIFNNAAQAWNHQFFWKCLTPGGSEEPSEYLMSAIEESFDSIDKFKEGFTKKAVELFGSGWTWLVQNQDKSLSIVSMSNAGNPLIRDQVPLLTCDVWEHAYYIDYRNARPKFLDGFWKLVNWEFVEINLEQGMPESRLKTRASQSSSVSPRA